MTINHKKPTKIIDLEDSKTIKEILKEKIHSIKKLFKKKEHRIDFSSIDFSIN